MTQLEKAERIAGEDREFARGELAYIAEWLRQIYPNMPFREIKMALHQMLDVSI